jgi:phosphatidylglycerophosphate synthase
VSAGHSATWVSWGSTLGWAAAVAAILTVYVRVLGASAGAGHYFCGPMAKQHRMAVMTAACVAAALEAAADPGGRVMTVALLVIIVGCLVTIARRTRRIVADLESR